MLAACCKIAVSHTQFTTFNYHKSIFTVVLVCKIVTNAPIFSIVELPQLWICVWKYLQK